ncbi:hypothetical protein D3C78_1330330 [compost metagenome]
MNGIAVNRGWLKPAILIGVRGGCKGFGAKGAPRAGNKVPADSASALIVGGMIPGERNFELIGRSLKFGRNRRRRNILWEGRAWADSIDGNNAVLHCNDPGAERIIGSAVVVPCRAVIEGGCHFGSAAEINGFFSPIGTGSFVHCVAGHRRPCRTGRAIMNIDRAPCACLRVVIDLSFINGANWCCCNDERRRLNRFVTGSVLG